MKEFILSKLTTNTNGCDKVFSVTYGKSGKTFVLYEDSLRDPNKLEMFLEKISNDKMFQEYYKQYITPVIRDNKLNQLI